MAYAQQNFGQQAYGGVSFTGSGPSLVSTDPAASARNVALNAPVSFVVASPEGLVPWSLNASLAGQQAVVAGAFVSGYTGSIDQTDNTTYRVTIATHPPFQDSTWVTLQVAVQDLTGIPGDWATDFHAVILADVGEVVISTEQLGVSYGARFTGSESVTTTETLGLYQQGIATPSETVTQSVSLLSVQDGFVAPRETVAYTESGVISLGVYTTPAETVPVAESTVTVQGQHVSVVEDPVEASEQLDVLRNTHFDASETVAGLTRAHLAIEGFQSLARLVWFRFAQPLDLYGLEDLNNWRITPLGDAYPAAIEKVEAEVIVLQEGVQCEVLDTSVAQTTLRLWDAAWPPLPQNYIKVDGEYHRVLSATPTTVTVQGALSAHLAVEWSEVEAASLRVHVTLSQSGRQYHIEATGLYFASGAPLTISQIYTAYAPNPTLQAARVLGEGQVLLTFSDGMRLDTALTSTLEYRITGPSTVSVKSAHTVGKNQVLLHTQGMTTGNYTVEVNAAGTPKDFAGNPIDPLNHTLPIPGTLPLTTRSLFADKGPIAKAPRTLQSGAAATVETAVQVVIPGGNFTLSDVGQTLTLTGAGVNQGTYKVSQVVSSSRLRLDHTLSTPDVTTYAWALVDLQTGQIADSPSDVQVLINNAPVVPEAVNGLLGQVLLSDVPPAGADIKLSYRWIDNPRVAFRGLNNPAFTLNRCNRNKTPLDRARQHTYRYDCVLSDPSKLLTPSAGILTTGSGTLTGAKLTDNSQDFTILAGLHVGCRVVITSGELTGARRTVMNVAAHELTVDQVFTDGAAIAAGYRLEPRNLLQAHEPPLARGLKYRAWERAYTATLNDPSKLRLNSPKNRVAFPPMRRLLTSVFVNYEADGLPEAESQWPWTRKGSGVATVTSDGLVVTDDTTGGYPTGQPLFWVRPVDLTFNHAFALAWRMSLDSATLPDGVWTGVAVGWADGQKALVLGFLQDGPVCKLGFLKAGFGNDPSTLSAWTAVGGAPVAFDWTTLHSYRLFQDKSGVTHLYVDGEVVALGNIPYTDLPALEELVGPFDQLEGVFFGSLSRPAKSTSTWAFLRYETLPTNPYQWMPSSFVSYEGDELPETSTRPWTPVGFHGTETILNSTNLLVDSTSATSATGTGLVGADFRGFVRLEPLLEVSSDVVLDFGMNLRSWTHGITPNALMAAIDDGKQLVQLCFLAEESAPKYSYGGRCLPEEATPKAWEAISNGSDPAHVTVSLVGRYLRITDASLTDGRIYRVVDDAPLNQRVVLNTTDYAFEFRCKVLSYTEGAQFGFCGVTADVFDGTPGSNGRTLGVMFRQAAGRRCLSLHSDGVPLYLSAPPGVVTDFVFDWFDGAAHTIRVAKSLAAGPPPEEMISVFVDGVYLGSVPYALFQEVTGDPTVSFGSATATPSSLSAHSNVEWHYCNAWRVALSTMPTYVGLWKGVESNTLLGYHLPLHQAGQGVQVNGNTLTDPNAHFQTQGVTAGRDVLLIDEGPNKGVYEVAAVASETTLTILGTFPTSPVYVNYRIPKQTDWRQPNRYRIVRDPSGSVSVWLYHPAEPPPPELLIQVGYNNMDLPASSVGVLHQLSDGLPAIGWGAFDPTNLSQSSWDFVRYGITRETTEMRAVPHHEVLNQRNVMASPDHIRTTKPHLHTQYSSSSTGVPPRTDPDFLRDTTVPAFTNLNEGTPLVPSTQSLEVRRTPPTDNYTGVQNTPEEALTGDPDAFLNDGMHQIRYSVPDDVLYNSLEVIETQEGERNLIAPAYDLNGPKALHLSYSKQTCLTYDGSVKPEDDASAATPWALVADDPTEVTVTENGTTITYGTGVSGTVTVYRNDTPLPDAVSMPLEVRFRLKVVTDSTGGTGDSGIRFGVSAPGVTVGLALVTQSTGLRTVEIVDLNRNLVVGAAEFDFLDGSFHTYRLVRDVGSAQMHLYIDT